MYNEETEYVYLCDVMNKKIFYSFAQKNTDKKVESSPDFNELNCKSNFDDILCRRLVKIVIKM